MQKNRNCRERSIFLNLSFFETNCLNWWKYEIWMKKSKFEWKSPNLNEKSEFSRKTNLFLKNRFFLKNRSFFFEKSIFLKNLIFFWKLDFSGKPKFFWKIIFFSKLVKLRNLNEKSKFWPNNWLKNFVTTWGLTVFKYFIWSNRLRWDHFLCSIYYLRYFLFRVTYYKTWLATNFTFLYIDYYA